MMISGSIGHEADTSSALIESSSHPSVLLVIQDAELLEILDEQLSAHSITVRVARDRRAALEELRRAVPAAVVVDLDASPSCGAELAEELTEWGLPVILTTASRDRPVIADAEYWDKPYEVADLVTVLSRAIERNKAQSKLPARVVRRGVLSR